MTTPDTQKGATTPTPLTDAVAVRGQSTSFPRASYFVDADHARTLERQLAQSEERVKALERLVHENTRMLDMCAMLTQDGPHCNKVGHITAQISRNRTLLSTSKTN